MSKVKVRVRGYWLANGREGRGPLGQSAARYPFTSLQVSEREIELTMRERITLRSCSCCGRATTKPAWHWNSDFTLALLHCEVCGSHVDENGRLTGWWGGPYALAR